MGLGTVVGAGLATRLLRLGPGRPFGEGSGLALAGAALFVEEACQELNLDAERGDFPFKTDTIGAWRFDHASNVAAPQSCSCASLIEK